MPVVMLITIWLLGWGAYRLLARTYTQLDPSMLAVCWLLGVGVNHILHFGIGLVFKSLPPLWLIGLLALASLVDLVRVRPHWDQSLRQVIRSERLWSIALAGGLIVVIAWTLIVGYANDTLRPWLGRAYIFLISQDYPALIGTLPAIMFAHYPMLITHLYELQLRVSDEFLSSKLLTVMFYLSTVAGVHTLLKAKTSRPVFWTFISALMPTSLSLVPLATGEPPLAAFFTMSVVWLIKSLQNRDKGDLAVTAVLLALTTQVKQEGVPLAGAVIGTLVILWIFHRDQREHLARTTAALVISVLIFALPWWLLVAVSSPNMGGDFNLAAFDPQRLPIIIQNCLIILANPFSSGALWMVFGVLIVFFRAKDDPLLWMPVVIFLTGMPLVYLVSGALNIQEHIVTSYDRIVFDVSAVALSYVAARLMPLSPESQEVAASGIMVS